MVKKDLIKKDSKESKQSKVSKEPKESKEETEIIDISKIKEWDPSTVVEHYAAIFLAKRRSGKSELLKNMLYIHNKQKRFDVAYLFSGTSDYQESIYDYIPKSNRHNFYDEGFIDNLVKNQKQLAKDILEEKNPRLKKKLQNILIILDDCIDDSNIRNSSVLDSLFTLGRHLHISVIVLSQSISSKCGIKKVQMDNSDLIVTFLVFGDYDRKIITDKYMSLFDDKKYARSLLNSITLEKQYQCIVLETYKTYITDMEMYVRKSCLPLCKKKFMIGTDVIQASEIPYTKGGRETNVVIKDITPESDEFMRLTIY